MRTSPARMSAPVPQSWIPIESLDQLPEMEDLLDPLKLVDSGQSRAVRQGSDGRGYVAKPVLSSKNSLEKTEARQRSHRRWTSKRRTLHLKRKARVQKMLFLILGIVLSISAVGGATSYFSKTNGTADALAAQPTAPKFIPSRVDIVIEGNPIQVLSISNTMDEFKNEQGLVGLASMQKSFQKTDYFKKSAPALEFRYPKVISVNIDSTIKTILATDLTVGEALKSNGIVVDDDDIVSISLGASARGVTNVSIKRVATSTRTAQESISFSETRENDSSLEKGKSIVKQVGSNGVVEIIYTQTMHDGQVASEVVASKNVIKQPVNQVVRVGTKPLGAQSGKASWYAHTPGTCAHKTLPFGTIVTVRNVNTGATTTCRVADRGPFVAGRIIDLTKDVFSRIASISQGTVPVSISW